ncbi:MAG: hypothetical protein [Wendovervirus sonii]|uniref:Baseplate wedge subunit n=1 Tax=phage Lak_Megaphage_Sonny TaxID=3109229 RepID=A0ABZ0Z6X1_9CAUD|nr:MAG: hypothetical protein [phage Lak_Megaphage_Sonny]
MAADNYKIFNGTVDEFQNWLQELSEDYSEAGVKLYEDINKSIVYISEDFELLPGELSNFDGAIFANGAIVTGGTNAKYIQELINPELGNVSFTVVNKALSVNCDDAITQSTIKAAKTVGYLKKDTDIPAGTNIQELIDMIFNPDLGVTPIKPLSTLTIEGTPAGDYEVGEQINITITPDYEDGYFKAIDDWGENQMAGCIPDMENIIYKRNNTACEATDTYTLSLENESVSYKATIPYAESTNIPVSKKGNPLPDVVINAGNATSAGDTYKAYYKYYYVKGTTTQLTENSTWDECISVCTTTNLLKSNVTVLGTEPEMIGDGIHKAYLYVLIPASKETPDFQDAYGAPGLMQVINNNLKCPKNQALYKLLAVNPAGTTTDKYKNLIIKK